MAQTLVPNLLIEGRVATPIPAWPVYEWITYL
jgi:hypothetical protein